MPDFYLNTKAGKDQFVHASGCKELSNPEYRKYLGRFLGPQGAIFEAKRYNVQAKVCPVCGGKHIGDIHRK